MLLHNKGSHNKTEKTTCGMGETIYKWNSWQGITLQNMQTAHVAQYKKWKWPNQKMDRKAKYTFLQRRHTDGQKHMKRCSASLISKEIQTKTTMTITSHQ